MYSFSISASAFSLYVCIKAMRRALRTTLRRVRNFASPNSQMNTHALRYL